ncbi:unnamed protein product [Closterium sp. Yama58-4]|nr:unnamed protein product [Closterium sp. Yama58-4]
MTHLRSSDTRYRAALKLEFLAENPSPMYITVYFLVTRLPDSLRSAHPRPLPLRRPHRAHPCLVWRLLSPLPLLLTSSVLRRPVRRPLLAGGAIRVGVRGVRVVGVAAEVAVAGVVAVEVVGAVEVVVAGEVEVAVEVAGMVEALVVAEGAQVAVAVELAGVEARELRLGVQLVEAEVLGMTSSNSRVGRRLSRRSSFVSGWPSVVAPNEEAATNTSGA